MRRSTIWSLGFLLLCGGVAGWLVAGIAPDATRRLLDRDLLRRTWNIDRPVDDPLLVDESHWFFMPQLVGDFDLEMDLELAENTDIDILLRRLEPRYVDEQLLPFTGRFSVLRLSTKGTASGDGWLTRDQALFGEAGAGVGLSAGHQATVWIEARGRSLHANVAGKKLGWFDADDFYGMFTMVAKGGNAAVHRFVIQPLPMPLWRWSNWLWAGLGVLASALVAAIVAMSSARRHYLSSGVAMVAFAWLVGRNVDSDLGLPAIDGMLALLGAVGAMGVLLGFGERGMVRMLVTFAAVAGLTALASSSLQHDTRTVDAVFGPKAGSAPSEAHAQLVRGPQGLLDVDHDGPRVFLLGGEAIYGRGEPGEHIALGLQSQLRARTREDVQVPCLPTAVDCTVAQQWRLFEGFYQGFEPRVVVFGVGAGNDEDSQLRAVLRQAKDWCERHGARLVVFADEFLSPSSLPTLRDAEAQGVPVVWARSGSSRAAISEALGKAIAPLLE